MNYLKIQMKRSSLAVLALLVTAALATAIIGAGMPTTTQAASPQKAAVTGLSAAPGSSPGEIDVTWDAHPAGAMDYRVKWAPEGENFRGASDTDWNANTAATGITLAGLTGGSDYKVKVRARFDANPKSDWSSVATATAASPPDPTPEPTPAPTAEPTPEQEIDYDQERNDAVSLGDIADAAPVNRDGTVDTSDPVDYFRFSLSQRRTVGLRIRKLDYNADLYLEDNDGSVIVSSENSGDQKEVLNVTLRATGANEYYYVRVEAKEDGQNDYRFRYLTEAPPQPPNSPATGTPAINGTAQVGETLTADTAGIADSNGLSNTSFAYQWVRSTNGTDTLISGATTGTFLLTQDELDHTITVRVSFTDDDGYSETVTSNATGPVIRPPNVNPNGLPTISGTPGVGKTLTADASGITDDNGLSNAAFTYQWVSSKEGVDADIHGATGSSYTLTSSNAGAAFKVTVGFTDDDGYSETVTSGPTAVLPAPQRQEGNRIARYGPADGTVPDDWGLIPAGLGPGDSFRLVFLTSTKSSLTSTDIADYNTFVQNRAAAGHADIQAYSALFKVVGSTAAVDARDNTGTTYTNTDKGVPIYWLNGAKVADDYEDFYDGSWDNEANDKNASGTNGPNTSLSSNYPATGSDHDGTEYFLGLNSRALGASFVRVGRPNTTGQGPLSSNTNTSSNQPLYGLSDVLTVVGTPTITGTAQVGNTLTADTSNITDPDGLTNVDYDYQWIRVDQDGANPVDVGTDSDTYTLVAADAGKKIKVQVDFTDDASNDETLTSEAYPDYANVMAAKGACPADNDWCATLSSGYIGVETSLSLNEQFGYLHSPTFGDLDPVMFTHGSTNYTVTRVYRARTTSLDGNTLVIHSLTLNVTGGTLPDGTVLDLGGQTLTVGTDTETNTVGQEQWDLLDLGISLNWVEGGEITVSLKLAPPSTDATVPDDWDLIPAGLGPGDSFRLIFLSSTNLFLSSTDIADYNTLVQNRAAAGHADIQAYSALFKVVGSTAAVDARDNTGTTYTTTDKGVPIYWLNGAKVADDYEDFYDGSWDDEVDDKNESGTNGPDTSLQIHYPATGSDHDGTETLIGTVSRALGALFVRVGRPDTTGDGPLSSGSSTGRTSARPLYGLSDVLTVVGAPDAEGELTITGTAQVGNTLTADTTGITDPDGLTNVDYSYQWIRVDSDGANPVDVGTDSNMYTLAAADAGKKIKVKVDFTDDDGNSNILDSEDYPDYANVMAAKGACPADNDWCATLTSGHSTSTTEQFRIEQFGYTSSLGALDPDMFSHGVADYTVTLLPWSKITRLLDETINSASLSLLATGGELPDGTALNVEGQTLTVGTDSEHTNVGHEQWDLLDLGISFNWVEDGEITVSLKLAPPGDDATVPVDWALIPTGLGVGDSFRLLFLTSTKSSLSSTSISTYNTFVQNRAAAGHTDIQDYASLFKVVGSTALVDARDNTGTTYTNTDKGVPIYWLGGAKVADEYEDFYDEDWDDEVNDKNESGADGPDTSQGSNYPGTGSDHDGTEEFVGTGSRALGKANVRLGRPNSSDSGHGPLSSGSGVGNAELRPLYGLSAVLTVVGAPDAEGELTITGTAQVGNTLTADTSGITDSDGLTNVDYTYQWIRVDQDGANPVDVGTDSNTYTLAAADAGKKIKVKVDFTDDASNSETLTSEAYPSYANVMAAKGACPADNDWCGTLTSGYDLSTSLIQLSEGFGYQSSINFGDLNPTMFTHAGTPYTVTRIYQVKNLPPDRSTVRSNVISVTVTAGQLPDGTVLNVEGQTLTVGTDSEDTTVGKETWDLKDLGIAFNWVEGGEITVSLKLAPPSTDATLSSLALEDADGADIPILDGEFDPAKTQYRAIVPNSVSSVKLTATPNESAATVAITDDDDTATTDEATFSNLAVGSNTFTVTVTAQDPTQTKTYTVDLLRADPSIDLVTNTSHGTAAILHMGGASLDFVRQGFETGPNPDGYLLTSVGFHIYEESFEAGETFTAYVHEKDGTALGSRVHTLVAPDSFTGTSVNHFTASHGAILEPDTGYFLAFTGTGQSDDLQANLTTNYNETGQPGWTIDDQKYGVAASAHVFRMVVKGVLMPSALPSLTIQDTIATEGSPVQFQVTLSQASTTDVTVQYSTSIEADDTATFNAADAGGIDLIRLTNESLTIPAGQTTATISVGTIGDSTDETSTRPSRSP